MAVVVDQIDAPYIMAGADKFLFLTRNGPIEIVSFFRLLLSIA